MLTFCTLRYRTCSFWWPWRERNIGPAQLPCFLTTVQVFPFIVLYCFSSPMARNKWRRGQVEPLVMTFCIGGSGLMIAFQSIWTMTQLASYLSDKTALLTQHCCSQKGRGIEGILNKACSYLYLPASRGRLIIQPCSQPRINLTSLRHGGEQDVVIAVLNGRILQDNPENLEREQR
mgnify:CR=1 FL=1